MNINHKIKYIIKEYLTRDGVALKNYLNLSDEEKIDSLPYQYPYFLIDYLEEFDIEYDLDGVDEIEFCENKLSNDSELFHRYGVWLYDKVMNNSLDIYNSEYPAWSFFDYIGLVKNQWLIHFTNHSNEIKEEGFTNGVEEIDKLGLTTHLSDIEKEYGGFNFAYDVNEFDKYCKDRYGFKYGKEMVIFQASGVKAWHYGDEEPQVIFYGSTAKNIVLVHNGDELDFGIRDKNDRLLYESDELKDIVSWVVNNYFQYRNVIY